METDRIYEVFRYFQETSSEIFIFGAVIYLCANVQVIACHVMSRFEIYFGSTKESFQRANPFENCLTMSFVSIT